MESIEEQAIPAANETLNLRRYWEVLRKRKIAVFAVLGVVTVTTLAYNLKQKPLYEATASLVIESLTPHVLSGVEEVVPLGSGAFWSREFYETEYKILQSKAIAQNVVSKLGLDKDLMFLDLNELAAQGDSEAVHRAMQQSHPAELLLKKLSVTPVKESKMVLIQYKDHDPARAAQLANAHAQAYLEYNLERKLEGTKTASRWLEEQLGDLTGKLETSELALYAFKKENNILAQSVEDRNELLKKRIEETSRQLQEIQNKRIQLKAKIDEIERAKATPRLREALPDVVQNTNIQGLRKAAIELEMQVVQLQLRYGDKYPKLVEAREQLEHTDDEINIEIDKIISAAETEYRTIRAAEQQLKEVLDDSSREALELNKLSVEYGKLRRENENNNRLYGVVMSRLKEADLTSLLKSNNVRIIDEALPPRSPIYPKTSRNVALALLIGLALGIALAFLLDYVDNTVKSKDDVQIDLGLTFLGILPNFSPKKRAVLTDTERDLYVYRNQRSSVAECSRIIRTNLTFMDADKPLRKLLLVSAKPAEGKTTNAINLATTIALSGSKTLLIDTDMRRPRLHRVFGFGSELGISNYVLGERTVDEIIKHTMISNLDLLPCGPLPPAPAELLHTVRFRALVEEVSKRYDRIIFDSPPIAAVADAPILASLVDGVVVVIKAGRTPKEMVRQSIQQLRGANATILGVIINDIDLDDKAYGYYYGYYRTYGAYVAQEPEPMK